MIYSYYKYYLETKNRFLLVFFSWGFTLIVCYLYKETLLFILINSNKVFDNSSYFIFTNVTEVFYTYIELSVFLANQVAILITFYQILLFLSLGLYQSEFDKLKFTFKIFTTCWLFSIALLYQFIVPVSWDFFLSFQQNSNDAYNSIPFFFEAKITEYVQYFVSLYYLCLLNCQFLALLTFFLANLSGKSQKTKKFRKLFYLIFVSFSTLITPPDIVSQISISFFLVVTYELLILLQQLKVNMAIN